MDDATDLTDAKATGASIKYIGEATIAQLEPFWEDMFADGSVQVPEGRRPAHWIGEELDYGEFADAWRAWQREIGFDPDGVA